MNYVSDRTSLKGASTMSTVTAIKSCTTTACAYNHGGCTAFAITVGGDSAAPASAWNASTTPTSCAPPTPSPLGRTRPPACPTSPAERPGSVTPRDPCGTRSHSWRRSDLDTVMGRPAAASPSHHDHGPHTAVARTLTEGAHRPVRLGRGAAAVGRPRGRGSCRLGGRSAGCRCSRAAVAAA